MTRVAFVFPDLLPLPAVRGGATETLIQRILDDNEINGDCRLDVYCRYDPAAEEAAKKYRNARFFYIRQEDTAVEKVKFLAFRLRRKFRKAYTEEPYLKKLTRQLRKEPYDYVVVESSYRYIPWLKKKTGAKVLLHLHFDAVAMNNPWLRPSLECCDGVICVSRFIRDSIAKAYPDVAAWVLPNVVDTAAFDPQRQKAAAGQLRAELGIGPEEKVVLYAGRLMEVKGVLELVRAFRQALRQQPDMKLVLAGSAGYGETTHDEFYDRLVAQIGDLLGSRVILTGYVDHGKMPVYYTMADVAVLPTTLVDEAAPLSVLEALACGCSVVGSDSGGIPELATCGDTVIVQRGPDFEAGLCSAILQLAPKKQLGQTAAGRAHVLKNHDACNYYHNFLQLLRQI